MRNPGIDFIRVIGVVAIVAGHVWNTELSKALLFGWHVPVFFFLSGYLWRQKTLTQDLRERWYSLGRPYLFWLALIGFYFLIIERFGDGIPFGGLAKLVLGGAYIGRPFSAFWFVTALLGASILMRLLDRRPLILKALVVLAGVLACYLAPDAVSAVPLALGVSVAALVFMYAGQAARALSLPANRKLAFGIPALLLGFAAFLTGLAAPLDMKYADLGTPVLSIVASALLCAGLTWTADAVFAPAPARLGAGIIALAQVSFVVVLTHAAVLDLMNTTANDWLPDFWIALIAPWLLGLLLIRTPLRYWAVGGRRPAAAQAVTA